MASAHDVTFDKLHGLGNDFLVFHDFLEVDEHFWKRQGPLLCRRGLGVGADGVLCTRWLEKAAAEEKELTASCRLHIVNSDGSNAEMCGNGVRCAAKFLHDRRLRLDEKSLVRLDVHVVGGGLVVCRVVRRHTDGTAHTISVEMGCPLFGDSPFLAGSGNLLRVPLDTETMAAVVRATTHCERDTASSDATLPLLEAPSKVGEPWHLSLAFTGVVVGVPHCVVPLPRRQGPKAVVTPTEGRWRLCGVELARFPVEGVGRRIELQRERFPAKTNVEFVHILTPHEVVQRTWERGCGETLACGSGASAVASSGVRNGTLRSPVHVKLPGGSLELRVDAQGQVTMVGEATFVFRGTLPRFPSLPAPSQT